MIFSSQGLANPFLWSHQVPHTSVNLIFKLSRVFASKITNCKKQKYFLNVSHLLERCLDENLWGYNAPTWTMNFQMFKLVLEKAEEPEIKLPTSAGSLKKQESSRKASISALLTMPKPLTVWTTINCGKFFKRWKYQATWPASWETFLQVRKQQLELDMDQQTGSK